tara:strand:- start:10536 stop:10775 length:240 start_codon:yes stop_codon:yes gene_type:complete
MESYFKHPKEVCMSYFKHFKLSLYFSYVLGKGSAKAFMHAFIPDYYITSTSDLVEEVALLLKDNGCGHKEKEEKEEKED